MLYTIYMWLVLCICTGTFGSALLLTLPFDRRSRCYMPIVRTWARLVIWASRNPVSIEGLEQLDPSRPAIYMTNHQSYFDVICLAALLPVSVRFLAKRILIYVPVLGQAMWASGHIIVAREDRKQSFQALDRAAAKIARGTSVLVFMEGTRSPDGRLGPFKKGGFVLGIKARVPIIPISISGTRPMMGKGSFGFTRTRVRMTVGHPVNAADFDLDRKEELMAKVRHEIIFHFPPDSAEAAANRAELDPQPPAVA
jgi:1-acyl-sn-glycerol-3-phosphate acyltransferase